MPKLPDESVNPLELAFDAVLKLAAGDPSTLNLREVWNEVEPILAQCSEPEQLRLAGTAIAQLAEVHHRRAEQLFSDWEESHNDDGPVISDELLAGLVQQTMYLDISGLTRKSQKRQRKKPSNPHTTESVVGEVEKEKILAFVDAQQEENEKMNALAVAHEENISIWVEAIASYLSTHLSAQEAEICFTYLCQLLYQTDSTLSVIKIWLALLLGGYGMEQRGDFYDGNTIWINRNR